MKNGGNKFCKSRRGGRLTMSFFSLIIKLLQIWCEKNIKNYFEHFKEIEIKKMNLKTLFNWISLKNWNLDERKNNLKWNFSSCTKSNVIKLGNLDRIVADLVLLQNWIFEGKRDVLMQRLVYLSSLQTEIAANGGNDTENGSFSVISPCQIQPTSLIRFA